MRINGEIYPGKHKPIIFRELFDKVQAVFRAANKPKKAKHSFAYAGMMVCGNCGCAITTDIKKGKYVYYFCTGNRGDCNRQYVREQDLSPQFDDAIHRLDIDTRFYDLISRTLKDLHEVDVELQNKAEE